MSDKYIHVDEFIFLIENKNPGYIKRMHENDYIGFDYDSTADTLLTRQLCARIIYEFLNIFINEKDVSDWSCAYDLSDLYDCNRCVRYIAQVYSKGIMDSYKDNLFGVNELVTYDEADRYIERMCNSSMRIIPESKRIDELRLISTFEFGKILDADKSVSAIDVRDSKIHKERPLSFRSVNIQFNDIYKNPYIVSDDKKRPVYLYCDRGYQSTLIARLLLKYGYREVYIINNEAKN